MSEPTSSAPPPPPPTSPTGPTGPTGPGGTGGTPPKKKGLSPIAWVGIGCLALLLIGGVLVFSCGLFVAKKAKDIAGDFEANPTKAAAELMVKINPELELVESDDDAGTMTVRNTKTGETVTVDFDEIAEGRFRFETDEGETTLDFEEQGEGGSLTVTGPGGKTTRFGGPAGGDAIPGWVPRYPGERDVASTLSVSGDDGENGMFTWSTTDDVDAAAARLRKALEGAGYKVSVQTISVGDSGTQVFLTAEGDGRSVNATLSTDEGMTRGTTQYSSGN